MKKQIYDFESEVTKKVEVGAFDTQNIGPDLELLKKQRESQRQAPYQQSQPHPQFQTPKPAPQQRHPQFQTPKPQPQPKPIRETQETIIIEDSLDDEFDMIMNKTKAAAIEPKQPEIEKKKVNWIAVGLGGLSLLLIGAVVFVSTLYFAKVSENTKMQAAVKEADDIKRNNNSQINTLTKQKEDIDTKLKDAQKEREELQKKLTAAESDGAAKGKELDAAKKAQEESQKKIEELQKKNEDLQKQIDNIKKAAGA